MTKTYEIIHIHNENIVKALQGESSEITFITEFVKFINSAYKKYENKSKIIQEDFYELFIQTDKSIATGGFYEEFRKLSLSKVPYSKYIFSFFEPKICFAVKELEITSGSNPHFIITDMEDEFEKECKNIDPVMDENLYVRKCKIYPYKVAFNKNIFIILDKYNANKNLHENTNLLKILLIQLLTLSYKITNNKFRTKLKSQFDKLLPDEILELRKSFFNYKTNSLYEIKEDRKEALIVFNMAKEYLNIESEYKEISQDLTEFFYIKDEEQKRREQKEREKEQTIAIIEREKREKFITRIMIAAAFVTIFTFISVIADIFNLLDRF